VDLLSKGAQKCHDNQLVFTQRRLLKVHNIKKKTISKTIKNQNNNKIKMGRNRKTGILAEQKGDRSFKEIKRTISKKAKQNKEDSSHEESM
jgi:hypothetical protein